jgi:tetratricopeptide (TPR) repeat protein
LEQAEKGRRQLKDLQKEALSIEFMNERDVKYRYIFEGRAEDIAGKANVNALSLVRQGLLIDAARWLRQFLEICDSSPTLYYNLGQIYNALDVRGEALRFGSKAIELKKDYRDAYDLMGNLCLKVQDLERSAWYYQEAVRIEPDSMAYYNLGCVFYEMNALAKAEESWLMAIKNETAAPEEAEKISKDDILKVDIRVKADTIIFESYQGLGVLYEKQGKLDSASAAFEKAIKLMPKMPVPYFELGIICLDRKEKEKADDFFMRYISLGGDEAKVKAVLSRK